MFEKNERNNEKKKKKNEKISENERKYSKCEEKNKREELLVFLLHFYLVMLYLNTSYHPIIVPLAQLNTDFSFYVYPTANVSPQLHDLRMMGSIYF